jgi:hypothetical protein
MTKYDFTWYRGFVIGFVCGVSAMFVILAISS